MKFLYILRVKSKSATVQSTRGNPFTELEKDQMISILNENPNITACLSESKKSVSVYYSSVAESTLESNEDDFDLEGFIRTVLPRKESKSEIIRKSKLLISDEKKAVHKEQTLQYLKDNCDIKSWVDSFFGEFTLNTYNVCALIRFLKGDDSEFNGILNWKCLITLQAHELASVDGEVFESKLLEYFNCNFKNPEPIYNLASEKVTQDTEELASNSLQVAYMNVTSETYIHIELENICDHAWIELSDIILKNNCGQSTVLHADSCWLESEATYELIKMGVLTDYEIVRELSGLDMTLNLSDLNNITATAKINDGDIGHDNTIVRSSIVLPTGENIPLTLVY